MWFLTAEGLNHYDGYDVTKYRSSNRDHASISHQYTTGIVEDSSGDLWIGTRGGLNKFDYVKRTFKPFKASETVSSKHPLSDSIS